MSEDWYDSEEHTRNGMISELQRIVRRTRARPLRVIALAIVVIGAIAYRITTKKQAYQAEIVLSLTEESMTAHKTHIPVDELKEYVWTVLMPDAKLAEIVEQRNLHRLRKQFGPQYGIDELRGQIDIAIWKNSFIEYKEEDANGLASSRIGITVTDGNPIQAFDIARDIASLIIKTSEKQGQDIANKLSAEVKSVRADLGKRAEGLATLIAQRQLEIVKARAAGKPGLAEALVLEVGNLTYQQKVAEDKVVALGASRDAIADQITAAGLDMTIEVIDEHRPEVVSHSTFVLILVLVVVALFSLIGSMLVVGTFDPRVHDTDDVLRLGLPMLGHVPGFPGDQVAALRTRGVPRRRVPSFLRWRSHR
jgi:capsular polysaccharide biosynthesis protein